MLRSLALVLGVLAVVSLPCLLVLVSAADEALERAWRVLRRRVRAVAGRARTRRNLPGRSWSDRRWFARLDRAISRATEALPSEPAGPPIERVAADLRRLARQRIDIAPRSPVWFAAVQRAYDDRLRIACKELCIEEYICELSGVDRDIERVRVEGSLQAAGMAVGSSDVGWRQDQR